jgi:sulfur-oxidizing protein SoxZ
MALARIDVPASAKRGEVIEVRILIQHPMETGFRRDGGGKRVPRNAIHSVACRCNGVEVFRATLSSGVAANPSIRFFMRAVESGDMELWWLDDEDVEGTFRSKLTVT